MNENRTLIRDCLATIIPAGEEILLEKGTTVTITQTLGGTITVRSSLGLFRIATKDLDALGDDFSTQSNSNNPTDNEPFSEDLVWQTLKNCYDPEIPINIVDLGLIYDLSITPSPPSPGKFNVHVKMSLTTQGCGMGPTIAADAKQKIETLPAVASAQVNIVWDPAWNPMMISEAGQKNPRTMLNPN